MADNSFEERLREITSLIATLPAAQQEQLSGLVEETKQRHAVTKDHIRRAVDTLDEWRLQQKYRIFDAEARLREAQARRRTSEEAEGDEPE